VAGALPERARVDGLSGDRRPEPYNGASRASVAHWTEPMVSDHPGGCAVAPSVDWERSASGYLLSMLPVD
jgi:hypothetical protein